MAKLQRHERFKDARVSYNKNGKQTMDEVAEATGLNKSMIGDLESDKKDRKVGYQDIAILSKHYGVTSDFLLGLTDDPGIIKCAVDDLGISPNAVKWIMEQRKSDAAKSSRIEMLNMLLETSEFSDLFDEICDYCYALKAQCVYEKTYNIAFTQDGARSETIDNIQDFRKGLKGSLMNLPGEIEIKEWLHALLDDADDVESMRHLMLINKQSGRIPEILKYSVSIRLTELLKHIEEDAKNWNIGHISVDWRNLYGND